jgi:uncharacterized protein YbcI
MTHLENRQQTELASYIGKLLRDNFGKGPEAIYVSISHMFITVYLRNFISPMERVLLGQKQEETVQQTRDVLMQTLIPEMKAYIKIVTGLDIREFYYDWGLHNQSGLFVGVSSDTSDSDSPLLEEYEEREGVHQEIINISEQAQKEPAEVLSYKLNPRTLIVIRNGILVAIEKELIRLGHEEVLRLAKRNLEKRLFHNNNHFESVLNTKVIDIFIDWDFKLDKSVAVFIMNPTQ